MKVIPAIRVCKSIEHGVHPMDAASEAISYLAKRVDGLGGVVVLDRNGRIGRSFNTPYMACAYIDVEGKKTVFV